MSVTSIVLADDHQIVHAGHGSRLEDRGGDGEAECKGHELRVDQRQEHRLARLLYALCLSKPPPLAPF